MKSFLLLLALLSMLKSASVSGCSCNGFLNKDSKGECNSWYRGKEWCYVDRGECSDERAATSSKRLWSYNACIGSVQCQAENRKKCQFPFRYKGKTFFSCTDYDSENSKRWCATEVTGSDRNGVRGSYVDCAEWYDIQDWTGLDGSSMEAKYGELRAYQTKCESASRGGGGGSSGGGVSLTQVSGISSLSLKNSRSRRACPQFTCRRGGECCKLVYQGRNRGYQCPRRC